MRKKRMLLCIIPLLVACHEVDYTLKFKDEMVLDLNTTENTISLIESVGDALVNEQMIDGNTLSYETFQVTCDEVDTSQEGNYEVRYVTNDTDNRYITKKVTVRDISPPVITVASPKLEMLFSEYQTYDFGKVITATDNSGEEPFIESSVGETIEAGKSYTVAVTATDEAGNQSHASFTLKVNPDPLPEPEPEPSKKPSTSTGSHGGGSSKPGGTSGSKPKKKKTYTEKFMFDDGYNMDSAYNACVARGKKMSSTWECTPMKNGEGIYTGYKLTYKK